MLHLYKLFFPIKGSKHLGTEHRLYVLCASAHMWRVSFLYFADIVCSGKEASVTNGSIKCPQWRIFKQPCGNDGSHPLFLLSLVLSLSSLSFSELQLTLRALKHTCLLISFQRHRKEDDFALLFYLSCISQPLLKRGGGFRIQQGRFAFSEASLWWG